MRDKSTPRPLGYLLAAAVLLALAFAVLPFDDRIAGAVRTFSHAAGKEYILQEALSFFRPFGKGEVVLLIAFALGVCGARRRATQIVLGLMLVSVLVWPFKWGVARVRPNGSNSESFPSGDVAAIAAFCTPLVTASPWAIPVGAIATAGVAAGRIYDGKHFPSDALAGAAFGILAGALAMALLRRRQVRPRRLWFLAAAMLVMALDIAKLPWARALPFVLACLAIWGPVAVFLLIVRLAPTLWRAWRKRRRQPWPQPAVMLLAVAAVLALYFLLAGSSTLWDRDEPRFARATVEMVASGNYLYPTFNGVLRPDKPILIYWLMSVPVRLFGPSAWACRMVAPLAMIVAGLLAWWAAARMIGPKAGLLAFTILALSPLMAVTGTAATTDALLLACTTATLCAFLLSWTCGLRPWHLALLTLALAAALLTKGPVGALPLLSIAAILACVRGGAVRPKAYLPWLLLAVIAATGLALAWTLPANTATQGEFLRRALGHHVIDRAIKPLESHGGHSLLFSLYYVPIIVFAFFPWTLYLPRLFSGPQTWTGSLALPAKRVLLCWALPVIVIMSLVATKLPHYILPAWPALAIASAAGVLQAARGGRAGNKTLAARIGFGAFLLAGATLGLGLSVAPWFVPVFGVRVPATGVGLLFLAMTYGGAHWYRRGRHEAVAGVLACGMVLMLLAASLFLLPALERYKISPRVAAAIVRNVPAGTPVATCGYGEPTLNFYLGWGPIRSLDDADLDRWATSPGRGILVITDSKWHGGPETLARAGIRTIAMCDGFNYSQGKWVRILVLLKDGT